MVTKAYGSPFGEARSPDLQLLRDCFSLGGEDPPGPSPVERLEAAVGRELAQRLLRSLTAHGGR